MRRATFADAAIGEGAAALNRVFKDYLVPITFSSEQLHLHMSYNDVDTSRSPMWFDDEGRVLAAALLAVRGKRGWIGGFGVAPEYRGQGYAKQLLEHVIETARQRGLESITLEVLKDNTPAIGLYSAGGFSTVRELRSFETLLENAGMPNGYVRTPAQQFIEEPDAVRPCWQRERATLRNGAVSTAVGDETGNYAVYRFNAQIAQVLKLQAASAQDLTALSHAVAADRAFQSVKVLNEPAESAIVKHALAAGWNEPFKQYEMVLELN
jgi:ribosomal protein S18 acetylase RimI-like enzyme